jgi:hypothetical protein
MYTLHLDLGGTRQYNLTRQHMLPQLPCYYQQQTLAFNLTNVYMFNGCDFSCSGVKQALQACKELRN